MRKKSFVEGGKLSWLWRSAVVAIAGAVLWVAGGCSSSSEGPIECNFEGEWRVHLVSETGDGGGAVCVSQSFDDAATISKVSESDWQVVFASDGSTCRVARSNAATCVFDSWACLANAQTRVAGGEWRVSGNGITGSLVQEEVARACVDLFAVTAMRK